MDSLRLLLVDDDPSVRRALGGTLSEAGYEVSAAEDVEEALARLPDLSPDLVLSDIRMPGLDGIELLKMVRERAPSVDVILMTAGSDRVGRNPITISAIRPTGDAKKRSQGQRQRVRRPGREERERWRNSTIFESIWSAIAP